jgi:hypothetical protein
MLRRVALVRTCALLRNVCRLLVTANVVPSSPILVTVMTEALSSSETSVLTRATRRNISEDAIGTLIFATVQFRAYSMYGLPCNDSWFLLTSRQYEAPHTN